MLVGIAAIAAFIYVNQSNLALEREKIQIQQEKTSKEAEQKSAADFSETLRENKCISDAEEARVRDLSINSDYESKDANGETVYHGDAVTFEGIESRAVQAKQACRY